MFLQKGDQLEQFIGQSGMMFDIVENHAVLFLVVNEEQLLQYKLGGHYEFWCTSFNEVLFIAAKLKSNPWAAAPFSPHLSSNYKLTSFQDNSGLPLTVALISNRDGIVKELDFMVLGNNFSNGIAQLCADVLEKPFDAQRYQYTIQAVYAKFPTDDDLVKEAGFTYTIE